MEDEDHTVDDLPTMPPGYAAGPPTIEEQISPFHEITGAAGITLPGPPGSSRPPPSLPQAQIRAKSPTIRGVGSPSAAIPPAAVPPTIINVPPGLSVPSSSELLLPDGPTVPDGMPMMMPADLWGGATDSQPSFDEESIPTDPFGRPMKGAVPAQDAPKVEISKSMEWDVSRLSEPDSEDPRIAPSVRAARRQVAAPTEVMLPALRQNEKKERSDVWLVVGLLVLVLVIVGLLGAVIVGVLHRMI